MSRSDREGLKRTTHLIAGAENERVRSARKWRVPVVDAAWIVDSIIADRVLSVQGSEGGEERERTGIAGIHWSIMLSRSIREGRIGIGAVRRRTAMIMEDNAQRQATRYLN